MENTPLQIEIQNIGTTTLIIPLGDIDIGKSTELRNAIHPVIQEAPKIDATLWGINMQYLMTM